MVQARGAEAVAFVDKFTTAPLLTLTEGDGAEGFFADARGWVIALTTILRTNEGLWIECDAASAPRLSSHLEHYHIREQVEFTDTTDTFFGVAVVGPEAAAWLAMHTADAVPMKPLVHGRVRLGDVDTLVLCTDRFGGIDYLVFIPREASSRLLAWLTATSLPQANPDDLASLRIEAGCPEACDIPEKTLPQELSRPPRAISFTKGCYLGQETVARIDALGHVNRTLSLVAVAGHPPRVGSVIVDANGESLGTITSSCRSPRFGGGLGLALVHRRGQMASGLVADERPARLIPIDHPAIPSDERS